jgi:trans-aconitate methyltransferase
MNTKSFSMMCDALANQEATHLFRQSLEESYMQHFRSYRDQAKRMIEKSVSILLECGNRPVTIDAFRQASNEIKKEIFKTHDKSFWFTKQYRQYKRITKPKHTTHELFKYIRGKSVLDFGCGTGSVSRLLHENNYNVGLLDRYDYRSSNAKHLPFYKMENRTDIILPKGAKKPDTVLALTVLHHISSTNIPKVLKRLRAIAKRLVIKEDILIENKRTARTKAANAYLKSNLRTQRDYLVLMDYFGNAIVGGSIHIANIPFPFTFKSLSAWKNVLQNTGWNPVESKITGFEKDKIHRPYQGWIIAE